MNPARVSQYKSTKEKQQKNIIIIKYQKNNINHNQVVDELLKKCSDVGKKLR
jgi:hypothetical protein